MKKALFTSNGEGISDSQESFDKLNAQFSFTLKPEVMAKLVIFALKSKRLSGEQKAEVLSALLENLQALPLQSIITFDEYGTVAIGGRNLEPEQAIAFRDGCRAMKDSFARKMIQEQVAYAAIKMGVHQGLNPDMILFSKAVLWYAQEENKLLSTVVAE